MKKFLIRAELILLHEKEEGDLWMDLSLDRYHFLLRVFVEGPRLTVKALASEAGLSRAVASSGYEYTPLPETIEKIAQGAARLLKLDAAQMLAWLCGEDEPVLDAYLHELLHLRRCTGCGGWFEKKDMYLALSQCRPCGNAKSRDAAFRRRLQRDPQLRAYYDRLRAKLPEMKRKDPELAGAIARALAAMRAIKQTQLARELGTSRKDIVLRFYALGITHFLFSVAAAREAAAAGARGVVLAVTLAGVSNPGVGVSNPAVGAAPLEAAAPAGASRRRRRRVGVSNPGADRSDHPLLLPVLPHRDRPDPRTDRLPLERRWAQVRKHTRRAVTRAVAAHRARKVDRAA